MDDHLQIVKALFKANGIDNNDDSLYTFFFNGISFPKFVAIAFNIESIPGILKNPKNIFQKKSNNDLALQYLSQNNDFFRKFTHSTETTKDKERLISDIINKIYLSMKPAEIMTKCNQIIKKIGVQYHDIKEMMNPTFLLLLLNVLTDHEVQVESISSDEAEMEKIMKQSFEKAKVQYIGNITNEQSFIIQIHIIFKAFDKKISEQKSKQEVDTGESIMKPETDLKPTESVTKDEKPQEKPASITTNAETADKKTVTSNAKKEIKTISMDQFKNISIKDIKSDDDDDDDIFGEEDDDEIQDETLKEKDDDESQFEIGNDELLEDEALLKSINFLAKKYFSEDFPSFTKFKQTLLNDFIPKFVMKFFNISTIENVKLSETNDSKILTKQGIKNVYSVINFLATKQKIFELLLFDFYTPFEREPSAKLFFRNFLNFFFLTESKKDMIKRMLILIGNSTLSSSNFGFNSKIPRCLLLLKTMRFITKDKENIDECIFNLYQHALEQFSVPLVFHNDQWKTLENDDVFPNAFFYQIQFLFNEWDSNKEKNHVVEIFLTTLNHFKKTKVPRYDTIVSSMKAKTIEPEQIEETEETVEIEEKQEKQEIKNKPKEKVNEDDIKKVKFIRWYKNRRKDKKNYKTKNDGRKSIKINEDTQVKLGVDSYLFWNPPQQSFIFNNGIAKTSESQKESIIRFEFLGPNRTSNNFFPKKEPEINQINPNSNDETDINDVNNNENNENNRKELVMASLNTHTSKETELYKIFYYKEIEKKWEFDSEAFQSFVKNKHLNMIGIKTPLVFIANSNEKDVIDFNSHFIHGLYPKLEKEEQIFVYPICDKALAMLSFTQNVNDASIKPIFLQIHVPESKSNMPGLFTILTQINCYLICLSSLTIMILHDNESQDQIRYYQKVLSLSKLNNLDTSYNDSDENDEKDISPLKKNNTLYLINYPVKEYDETVAIKYHNHSAFSSFIDKNDDHEILLVDVNNVETYDHFSESLSTILIDCNINLSYIEKEFSLSLSNYQISSKYISIRSLSNWTDELKYTIKNRHLMFASQKKNSGSENISDALTLIYTELNSFSPRFDTEFVKEFSQITLQIRKDTSQIDRDEISKELNVSSDIDVTYISNLVKEEEFITEERIDDFRRNHELFVKNEYYNIVKLLSNEFMFDLVYEDNFDLVSDQIKTDRIKLEVIINDIKNDIQKRMIIKECNAQEEAKKNTNYMLKETENLREIKVEVKLQKDLTSVIEQDF